MRKNNSTFVNTPSGWSVCGGVMVPKNKKINI